MQRSFFQDENKKNLKFLPKSEDDMHGPEVPISVRNRFFCHACSPIHTGRHRSGITTAEEGIILLSGRRRTIRKTGTPQWE